jgi:hypothetical protein
MFNCRVSMSVILLSYFIRRFRAQINCAGADYLQKFGSGELRGHGQKIAGATTTQRGQAPDISYLAWNRERL